MDHHPNRRVTSAQTVLAVIPARLESTRLPRKILADLAGRPMLAWTWEVATRTESIDEVVVATDSMEVVRAVSSWGGTALHTGPQPSGTDRVAVVARTHPAQYVIGVQADEPFLEPAVLDALVHVLQTTGCDLATPCCPLDLVDQHDPGVVKCGPGPRFSRSHFPDADRHLGVYGWKREALIRFAAHPPVQAETSTRLEQLRALHLGLAVRLVPVRAQLPGVDTPRDLVRARQLAEHSAPRKGSCAKLPPCDDA